MMKKLMETLFKLNRLRKGFQSLICYLKACTKQFCITLKSKAMSKVSMYLTGEASGKFGGAVFFKRKGEFIMRVYAKPANPRTEGQVSQREKFIAGMEYLKLIEPIVDKGWKDEIGPGQSAMNVAFSEMLRNAMVQVTGVWQVDPTKLMHAKGPLLKADDLAATNPSGQTII